MIRNNLNSIKNEIPNINIIPYSEWKQSMQIEFFNDFSITDLYIVLKSYSDSLIIVPTQIMVLVEDLVEKRKFFSESVSIHTISQMSLIDFSIWYNNRWEKDSKYVGHEIFCHNIIFKFFSIEYEVMYPIYPWTNSILNEVLSNSIIERDEKTKILLKKIILLEEELKKYKK